MPISRLNEHRDVQAVAKRVMHDLANTITTSDCERSIAARASEMLAEHGIRETWYYDCPALVLLGSRSTLSASGSTYVPAEEPVGDFNLVTVDLSPVQNGIWGDCARSFFIENGAARLLPSSIEFLAGLQAEQALHAAMRGVVTPNTTFEELFQFANAHIQLLGFENLDFQGNVGHSIESSRADRRYIELGNKQTLGMAALFTFEPHIRRKGGHWGFKHENIYYFDEHGCANEL